MKERRNTRQRALILETVQNHRDHPSAEQIYAEVRAVSPKISRGTVYRNLKLLVESGWLKKIHAPERGTLYEIGGKAHHHHFQCRRCERMFEIEGCAFNDHHSTPPGFVTEGHEVFFFGVCAACAG